MKVEAVYICEVCEKESRVQAVPESHIPTAPEGWGVVTDYHGQPETVVCSPACYAQATGRGVGVEPAPEPGAPAEQLADVALVLESVAIDQRRAGEPVAAWLERTLTAMRGGA